jgi:hypothetical protein
MQGVEEANRLMDAGGGITALGSWVGVEWQSSRALCWHAELFLLALTVCPQRLNNGLEPGGRSLHFKRTISPRLLVSLPNSRLGRIPFLSLFTFPTPSFLFPLHIRS